MTEKAQFQDKRVKKRIFPVTTFLPVLIVFAALTTLQMKIIGENIDYRNIPLSNQVLVGIVWLMTAAAFTLLTSYQVTHYYQKPIEQLSDAARRVASGDFSVYIAPYHTVDKYTHLDVLYSDFNIMIEELGSIETLKTDFVSNVSHEIKTPLAVIQNNVQLLQSPGLSDAQRKECTDTILHATRRLSNLITNMLKLNKLEKQTIQPLPEKYDLSAQLCDCALQFEDTWEKKKIEFIADIEERTIIENDEGLLELVWTNLLSNALKFTPDGGTVTISQHSDGREVTVSVADTGYGMSEATKKRIFDKFYQGDTSHSGEGNGLGLPLVKRILQLTEGTVTVESKEGVGTTFTVRLPISRENKTWK